MTGDYISRLVDVLNQIDVHIEDRTKGLELRKGLAVGSDDLWVRGGAETLAAWVGAKEYILNKFPEVTKVYEAQRK
ncbi:hypothetical protein J4477_01930 [Candidatus Pacearchaeota archaeon]|nr:hypothetical protein [Candidatus Pacearchaeota archaeon]